MSAIREKQTKALGFIQRAYDRGFRDIVIAAPTGAGKAAIAAAACFWGEHLNTDGVAGGYMLTHQKLLQDQMEYDIQNKFVPKFKWGVILKSATEYPCDKSKNCQLGALRGCGSGRSGTCAYKNAKSAFLASPLAVTNYPYFFTERAYVRTLEKRRVLVCDEAHCLESQILDFVNLTVSESLVKEYVPQLSDDLPEFKSQELYIEWLIGTYLPEARQLMEMMAESGAVNDERDLKASKLSQHVARLEYATALVKKDPTDWIFWEERDKEGRRVYTSRPLNAAPFFDNMVGQAGSVRIYTSAFPGSKGVFCRSLGLDESKVAWCSLSSTFEVKNRRVVSFPVGSMSRANLPESLPNLLRMVEKIATQHKSERGIIHCTTYAIGERIEEHLKRKGFGSRVVYPKSADERDAAFEQHKSKADSIIISPSMTEGYNFEDDLCRWQIIAKVNYKYLGDKQVAEKMRRDPEWYGLTACMSIVQACGRGVRHEADHCITYILDSDFRGLWNRYEQLFPRWFKDSVIWKK